MGLVPLVPASLNLIVILDVVWHVHHESMPYVSYHLPFLHMRRSYVDHLGGKKKSVGVHLDLHNSQVGQSAF